MLRAKVDVELCHVEDQGKSTKKRQTKGKKRAKTTRATRKKAKPVDSETETMVSGWEDEDELNAPQLLQGDDPGFILIEKRSADSEGTLPGTESGNPVAKRPRIVYEVD
jgi:hypothetical protein